MQIICISRGSYSQGKELAETLAGKLGCPCLSREDLVEEAIRNGIAVGKLEASMLKPQAFSERLVTEKEHYQAFATAYLCGQALKSNLVYHGRTGHLLLPGISHVLRLRVVENIETRIDAAMTRMNVTWDKARSFVETVDDDVKRWVKTFYDVDWATTSHYDLIVNLEQMSVPNAATALCTVAGLPDFQMTPASMKAMQNLHLAAEVRVALARDERTFNGSFRVTAQDGDVLITYLPRYAVAAEAVPDVVRRVEGVRTLRCTMASTNILWIQETYDPEKESYKQIVELAKRWNSAVELLRFMSWDDEKGPPDRAADSPEVCPPPKREYNGGIEDDVPDESPGDDGGLRKAHDSLARDGVAGGMHAACCQANRLLDKLDARVRYTLVVIGDIFLGKGHAAQVRMSRELASALSETLKVPVVTPEELKKKYLFTPGLLVKLLASLAMTAGIFFWVFTHQAMVLEFLHAEGVRGQVLAAAAVALITPLFAYLYGTFTMNVLKLLRIE